jgi:manganese transport protein
VITKLPHSVHLSLEEMHGSVKVPHHEAGFWEQWRAFVGPAILVSVGYMDPGNWGTDLQGGARFKYGLLWVVGVASLMAIFMQVMSARLGVVTGKDLAQRQRGGVGQQTIFSSHHSTERLATGGFRF